MIRYPYDENGFYTWNPIETDEVLPNTSSVEPPDVVKPKIVDTNNPDSGWIMGLTPAEVETYLIDAILIRDQALNETGPQALAQVKDRIPMRAADIANRKAAEVQYIINVLRAVPNFEFVDKTKVPAMEITYRQTMVGSGTSVEMTHYIDADVLREVVIAKTEIDSFSWDKETQTLSGVSFVNGDKLVLKF